MFKRLFARIGQPEAAPPWGLAGAFAAVVALFAALVLGTTLTFMVYCALPGNAPYCQAVNFTVPGYITFIGWTLGALITIGFVRFTRRTAEARAALRVGQTGAPLFLLLLIGVGLAVTLDVITLRVTTVFLPEPELLSLYRTNPGALAWILGALFVLVVQPITEELVFRGALLPAMRASLGAWPGYLTHALVYAIFHLLVYPPVTQDSNGLWYGLLLPLFSGLIFGAVRLYTGSTRAAMLTHTAFGLFALARLLALGG